MLTDANRSALIQLVGQKAPMLYALYDAAQNNSLLANMQRHNIPHDCLFSGAKGVTLRNVAPYLLSCQHFAGNPERFLDAMWQRGVSMLVEGAEPLEQVKLQLKKHTYVTNSEGVECYFRYYDARAFSRFTRIANGAQLNQFFGSAIRAIYWHDSETQGINGLAKKPPGALDRLLAVENASFDITKLS